MPDGQKRLKEVNEGLGNLIVALGDKGLFSANYSKVEEVLY
jgi:hypothetical protein